MRPDLKSQKKLHKEGNLDRINTYSIVKMIDDESKKSTTGYN